MEGNSQGGKFEIPSTKHETNSKSKCSNVQNVTVRIISSFGYLDLGNLNIVSDFDIRISDLLSAANLQR